MILNIRHILLFFFVSLFFYTPFNYTGITPLPILIATILFFINILSIYKLKIPKFNLLDFSLIFFLIYLILNFLLNIDQIYLNLNHLIAYNAVIILYYFTIRISFYNFAGNNFDLYLDYLTYALIFIIFFGILDYILLQKHILYEDFLPITQANTISGFIYDSKFQVISAFWARPRGLFPEPIILAYAVLSIAPVVLAYIYYYKKSLNYVLLFISLVLIVLLSRSAAGIFSFIIALFFTSLLYMHRLKLSFKVRKLDIFLVCITISLLLISYNLFYNYVIHFLNVIYGKLVFLNNDSLSVSASSRIDRWVFVVEYFFNSNLYNMLFGYGPGYESAGGLEGGSTVNWYLNILVDYGLFGLLLIAFIFIGSLKNILSCDHHNMKFSMTFCLIFCFVNLVTHTGFYFPFLWIILILSNLTPIIKSNENS